MRNILFRILWFALFLAGGSTGYTIVPVSE